MAGDYPALFTIPYVQYAYAIYKLFNGFRSRRVRPITEQLRVFNAAQQPIDQRGLGRGPTGRARNPAIPDETLPSRVDEAYQRAAERRQLLAELDRLAPLAKDAAEQYKLAKKRREELERGKIEAQTKESARRAREFRRSVEQQTRTRDTGVYRGGIVRPYTSGLSAGALLIGDALFQRSMANLRQHWKRVQHLKLNRRGALAARPLDKLRARTGRTAAGDTGRLRQSSAGDAAAPNARTGVRSPTQPGAQPKYAPQTSVASSADARARAIMQSSPSLPAAVQASASPLMEVSRIAQATLMTQVLGSRSSTRAGARAGARTRAREAPQIPQRGNRSSTPQAPMLPFGLTALEAQGVQSASSNDRCNCPKPQKKRRQPRCTNPIVSKKTSGDLITTVRKLQCQPSKPK